MADLVDDPRHLRGGFSQDTDQHGGRLCEQADQHGECLFAGRQRGQHFNVRPRICLSANCHQLGFQLLVCLGKFLDQATGSAGIFRRKGVQQRTSECVLDTRIVGAVDSAGNQGVFATLM